MKLGEFDYELPKELIAQEPKEPRDHSRLLIMRRKGAKLPIGSLAPLKHDHFYDLPEFLKKGDVLVLNNSKVFPARLIGQRKESGGKVEVFLLRNLTPQPPLLIRRGGERAERVRGEVWQCLVGGHRRKDGLEVEFDNGLECRVIKNNGDGTFEAEFNKEGKELMNIVNKIGQTPLPPYIKRLDNRKQIADNREYQTVYADDKKTGSVAAPTAGLHFTPELIGKLKKKGVQFEYVTLHVGLGTFAPVKVDDITKHKMHTEWVEVDKDVIERIAQAKKNGRRIIAVGTTSVRTLEAVFTDVILEGAERPIESRGTTNVQGTTGSYRSASLRSRMTGYAGFVDIFIYPGYKFKVVDAMITNFHLPKSTLLMLVSAFAGKDNIDKAYKTAIKNRYRFYSYGDAMLII